MNIGKMREEFERTNGRDHRRQPPKGDNYTDAMAQADWESFQKGWKQSRESLVIELPTDTRIRDEDLSRFDVKDSCQSAIEDAGLKVKP